MSQGFSQIQTGLLTNQPSKKNQEPQKEYDIEMEDMTNQQSNVLPPNEQTNQQSKQQQLNNNSAQPQQQGNNHLSQNQKQHINQNQQQKFVPQSIPINYQYNKQQFAIKQHLSQTHYAVCQFCRTSQSIANDQNPFMCYQCRQVQQPTYELFKCANCNVTVKYQKGISSIIRCTRCNNYNLLNLQSLVQGDKNKV